MIVFQKLILFLYIVDVDDQVLLIPFSFFFNAFQTDSIISLTNECESLEDVVMVL